MLLAATLAPFAELGEVELELELEPEDDEDEEPEEAEELEPATIMIGACAAAALKASMVLPVLGAGL